MRLEYDTVGQPVQLVEELERRVIEIQYRSGLIDAMYFSSRTGRKLQVQYEYDHRLLFDRRC